MANEEQLAILHQVIDVWYENPSLWNEWRRKNPKIKPDLRGADLSKGKLNGANFSGADFRDANLQEANLRGANLESANLSGANLVGVNLNETNLIRANVSRATLALASLQGADLRMADFREANLSLANFSYPDLSDPDSKRANLSGANFSKANLYEANLTWTDLSNVNFSEAVLCEVNLRRANLNKANLSRADLTRTQVLDADFNEATFTGACIEEWYIGLSTNLNRVSCDYVYLKSGQQERRPLSGNFAPGEFTKLFQKVRDTIDLIFRSGVDWAAFAYSFRELQVENENSPLEVTGINNRDGVMVVQVKVPPEADKAKLEGDFWQGYEFAHKALEQKYQAQLQSKDAHINQLFTIITALIENPREGSKYYLPHAQFAGGLVDTVQGNQTGGNINNNAS
jgi:uncharacterized protein YjbI with pentapeptide repeats